MNLDTPEYPLSAVAAATGYPLRTLRDYMQRYFTWHEADERAHTRGATALLSLRSVLRIAIARQLNELGVPPGDAFKAALHFTDFGSIENRSFWLADGDAIPKAALGALDRAPGELFDPGKFSTWLAWSAPGQAWVVASERDKLPDLEALNREPGRTGSHAFALVGLNDLVERVCDRLEGHGRG